MVNKDSLKSVIGALHTGKKFPALQLVKSDPDTAALISKLVKPRDPTEFNLQKPDSYYNLNQSQIQAISDSTKSRIRDNENIVQLFPDIELAIQILVSSILSPKDMVKTDIIYKSNEPILPSELLLKINEIVASHFENYYHVKDNLTEILRDTLFTTGSYIKAIIPESAVDDIINQNKVVSTEGLSELFINDARTVHLGILGNPGTNNSTRFSLERFVEGRANYIARSYPVLEDNQTSISLENLVEITDNYKLLKLPNVITASNKSKLKSIVRSRKSVATESSKLTNTELSTVLYKNNAPESQAFVVIPTKNNAKRKSIGRPLVLRLPSESVIPVYIPGDEGKHIGYFVLVDTDGNPVTLNSSSDALNGLSGIIANQQGQQNQSLSSLLISKAKRNLTSNDGNVTLDQVTKVYTNIIETDLIQRLNNGLYGSNVEISNNEEVYRIMLARSLAGKYTRLIYIPSELTTYFAFKYFANGIGKSYLDDLKVLTSLRAILMFSKVMAMTKNSIALTHVNMTLDPNDPDPQKTIEMATHEIVKMRQQYFPLGINSPVDLVDWIQRAGFEFSFEGHPGLPQTKFDFETKNLQHTVPDSDLDELLRKQTYMAFGLSPETVDNGFNSEFATTVVSNNILLSKRVMQLQQTFTRQLTDYCRKLCINDSVILQDLKDILQENKGLIQKSLTDEENEAFNTDQDSFLEDLIERVIDNLELDLPKPDITSVETQVAAFDQYVESLDKTIDAWINSEFITVDVVGEISSNIDTIKAIVKSHFIRRWMSENGFMPELNDIVTSDEDGKPTVDIYEINKNHMEGIVRSAIKFIESMNPIKQAANTDIENLNVEPGTSTDTTTDDSSSTNDLSGLNDATSDDAGLDIGNIEESSSEETTDKKEGSDDVVY